MTNEQLAQLIQNGRKDLIPELWDRVQKLLYMKSDKLYRLHQDNFDRCGVEAGDIKQASYFAFLEAVRAFKPDSGLKFTAYLNYPFKNAVNELTGSRTSRTINEPLNNSASIEKPLGSSEEDVITLLETLADESSLEFISNMETNSTGETVRAVVDTLPDEYRAIITARYFEGLSLQGAAEKLSMSRDRVRQREVKALRILRENKILRELWRDFCQQRHYSGFSWFRTSPEYFALLKALDQKPLSYGQRQAELYEAQLIWEAQNDVRI